MSGSSVCCVSSPSVAPFPPRTPLPVFRFCSPVSQVLWDHLTSPSAYMSDVRPVAFSDRSLLWGSRWDLPVLASGVSMHAQVLRLRRVFRRLAILRCLPCCLPHSRTRSARGTMQISELNGWPACSPCPCHTQDVTVLSVGFGAEWLARPFSYDSFIRYSRPVYPGAFPAPAPGAG